MNFIIFSYQFRLKVVFLKSQFQPFKTVVLETPDLNPLTHSHHVHIVLEFGNIKYIPQLIIYVCY